MTDFDKKLWKLIVAQGIGLTVGIVTWFWLLEVLREWRGL